MKTQSNSEQPIGDIIILLVIGAGLAVVSANWLVGNLAALVARRQPLDASLVEAWMALRRMPDHWGDPRRAWAEPAASKLPGPVLYWASAAVVLAALLCVAVVVLMRMNRRHEPIDQRRHVGVETQARLARSRDMRALLSAQPQVGRFVLARWGRRRWLSTEADVYKGQRGVRGAVGVFGPSQSGKTTGLIAGVEAWTGPAIVSSVKTDLMRATLARRSDAGEVKVFDPAGITGMTTQTWSPLRGARTLAGAMAAGQMLARSGARGENQYQFWQGQAEQLLAAMLWTAANTKDHSMRNVVKWVLELDRPGDDRNTLAPLVRLLADHNDPAVAAEAREVGGWLHGQWKIDERTVSNVYATARNAVWPWADPGVAASADGCDITLDWLLDGANTLYLCAPLGDETRIGAVFAIVLHDLITQAFARSNRVGPIDPRLLVLLDEAGNTPLPNLSDWASTVTGAGIQLVTVWQSKAQLEEIYARKAENVLTNHRSKLFYPSGLSDLATIEYICALMGNEHVRSDLDEPRWGAAGERPPARSPSTAVPFLTASVLRRMKVGDAFLIHGQLPVAWIRARRVRSRPRRLRRLRAGWRPRRRRDGGRQAR